MKFTCEKNALVSAISVASRTVAQKSTIPALEGIYIRAGVKLTLSGYNLETGITISVDADIQETGACIMPSRLFFDIIRKLPDDTVSISVDENFKVSKQVPDRCSGSPPSPLRPCPLRIIRSCRRSTPKRASTCRKASSRP